MCIGNLSWRTDRHTCHTDLICKKQQDADADAVDDDDDDDDDDGVNETELLRATYAT